MKNKCGCARDTKGSALCAVLKLGIDNVWQRAAVYAVLVVAALLCLGRGYWFETTSDDIIYGFYLDRGFEPVVLPDGAVDSVSDGAMVADHSFRAQHLQCVNSFGDAVDSQMQQWREVNGRVFIHTVVQMFCGVWGRTAFAVCNALILLLSLWGMLNYVRLRNGNVLRNFGFALAAMLAISMYWLYLVYYDCGGKIDMICAYSVNYLWPVPLVLYFLVKYREVLSGTCSYAPLAVAGLSLLAFAVGSTQEVFVLPLCVMTAAVGLYKLLRKRSHITVAMVLMSVSLWIGAALLGLAPGTLRRSGELADAKPMIATVFEGVTAIVSEHLLFDVAVVLLLAQCVRMRSVRRVVWQYRVELVMLLSVTGLAVLKHTFAQSYTGVRFYALLFILSWLCHNLRSVYSRGVRMAVAAVALVGFGFYTAHQLLIVSESRKLAKHNYELIERYIASTDGVYEDIPVQIHPWATAHVYNLSRYTYAAWFCKRSYPQVYSPNEKPMVLMRPGTKQVLTNFDAAHTVPGFDGFKAIGYNGEDMYCLPVDSLKETDKVLVTYSPVVVATGSVVIRARVWAVKALQRLRRGVLETDIPMEQRMLASDIPVLKTKWGDFYTIPVNRDDRKLQGIVVVRR